MDARGCVAVVDARVALTGFLPERSAQMWQGCAASGCREHVCGIGGAQNRASGRAACGCSWACVCYMCAARRDGASLGVALGVAVCT